MNRGPARKGASEPPPKNDLEDDSSSSYITDDEEKGDGSEHLEEVDPEKSNGQKERVVRFAAPDAAATSAPSSSSPATSAEPSTGKNTKDQTNKTPPSNDSPLGKNRTGGTETDTGKGTIKDKQKTQDPVSKETSKRPEKETKKPTGPPGKKDQENSKGAKGLKTPTTQRTEGAQPEIQKEQRTDQQLATETASKSNQVETVDDATPSRKAKGGGRSKKDTKDPSPRPTTTDANPSKSGGERKAKSVGNGEAEEEDADSDTSTSSKQSKTDAVPKKRGRKPETRVVELEKPREIVSKTGRKIPDFVNELIKSIQEVSEIAAKCSLKASSQGRRIQGNHSKVLSNTEKLRKFLSDDVPLVLQPFGPNGVGKSYLVNDIAMGGEGNPDQDLGFDDWRSHIPISSLSNQNPVTSMGTLLVHGKHGSAKLSFEFGTPEDYERRISRAKKIMKEFQDRIVSSEEHVPSNGVGQADQDENAPEDEDHSELGVLPSFHEAARQLVAALGNETLLPEEGRVAGASVVVCTSETGSIWKDLSNLREGKAQLEKIFSEKSYLTCLGISKIEAPFKNLDSLCVQLLDSPGIGDADPFKKVITLDLAERFCDVVCVMDNRSPSQNVFEELRSAIERDYVESPSVAVIINTRGAAFGDAPQKYFEEQTSATSALVSKSIRNIALTSQSPESRQNAILTESTTTVSVFLPGNSVHEPRNSVTSSIETWRSLKAEKLCKISREYLMGNLHELKTFTYTQAKIPTFTLDPSVFSVPEATSDDIGKLLGSLKLPENYQPRSIKKVIGDALIEQKISGKMTEWILQLHFRHAMQRTAGILYLIFCASNDVAGCVDSDLLDQKADELAGKCPAIERVLDPFSEVHNDEGENLDLEPLPQNAREILIIRRDMARSSIVSMRRVIGMILSARAGEKQIRNIIDGFKIDQNRAKQPSIARLCDAVIDVILEKNKSELNEALVPMYDHIAEIVEGYPKTIKKETRTEVSSKISELSTCFERREEASAAASSSAFISISGQFTSQCKPRRQETQHIDEAAEKETMGARAQKAIEGGHDAEEYAGEAFTTMENLSATMAEDQGAPKEAGINDDLAKISINFDLKEESLAVRMAPQTIRIIDTLLSAKHTYPTTVIPVFTFITSEKSPLLEQIILHPHNGFEKMPWPLFVLVRPAVLKKIKDKIEAAKGKGISNIFVVSVLENIGANWIPAMFLLQQKLREELTEQHLQSFDKFAFVDETVRLTRALSDTLLTFTPCSLAYSIHFLSRIMEHERDLSCSPSLLKFSMNPKCAGVLEKLNTKIGNAFYDKLGSFSAETPRIIDAVKRRSTVDLALFEGYKDMNNAYIAGCQNVWDNSRRMVFAVSAALTYINNMRPNSFISMSKGKVTPIRDTHAQSKGGERRFTVFSSLAVEVAPIFNAKAPMSQGDKSCLFKPFFERANNAGFLTFTAFGVDQTSRSKSGPPPKKIGPAEPKSTSKDKPKRGDDQESSDLDESLVKEKAQPRKKAKKAKEEEENITESLDDIGDEDEESAAFPKITSPSSASVSATKRKTERKNLEEPLNDEQDTAKPTKKAKETDENGKKMTENSKRKEPAPDTSPRHEAESDNALPEKQDRAGRESSKEPDVEYLATRTPEKGAPNSPEASEVHTQDPKVPKKRKTRGGEDRPAESSDARNGTRKDKRRKTESNFGEEASSADSKNPHEGSEKETSAEGKAPMFKQSAISIIKKAIEKKEGGKGTEGSEKFPLEKIDSLVEYLRAERGYSDTILEYCKLVILEESDGKDKD